MRAATVRPIAAIAILLVAALGLFACSSSTGPDGDDGDAPAPIADFAVASFTTHSITLTWTASGDDGNEGTADRYELRGSDEFIAPDDWEDAVVVPGCPTPGPAGTTETMTVDGLEEDMTYYFMLMVFDEEGNTPGCSICVSATCYDNSPVVFDDPVLEAAVRSALDIPSGPLLRQDVRELRDLHLPEQGIADLTGLEECLNLGGLVLYGNEVTDLAPLAGLTQLSELDLNDNAVADLTPLASCPALVHLRLDGNAITGVGPLAGLTDLELLHLARNQVADLTPLAGLTALTSLHLEENAITDLSPLAGLTLLEDLKLQHNAATSLAPLAGLTALGNLDISYNPVVDLAPLAGMTAMWSLTAFEVGATTTAPLAGMTAMRTLLLSNNAISDLSGLADMAALEYLSLGGNQVTSIATLAGKPYLTRVYIHFNAISDLGPLADLPALELVYANYNQIGDLQALVDNADLAAGDVVNVENNPLSADAINVQIPALEARGVVVEY